jgi:hypothetical protein
MQNLNNIVQSEQLKRNGRIPESSRSIRSLYFTKGRNVLKKIILPTIMGLSLTSCGEFALLSSGAGIAASNSVYAKTYNGVDLLTTIKTKKSIKQHAYDTTKKSIETAKQLKEITQEKLELQNELKHLKMKKEVESYEQ